MDAPLIEAIYEAPIEPEPWSSFVHACRLRLKSRSALLMFRLPLDGGAVTDIADAEWTTEAMRRVYYEKYAVLNPLKYEQMQVGRPYTFSDFLSKGEFRQSSYYQEYCQALGIEHAAVLYLGEANGLRAWLNLSRDAAAGAYKKSELELLARMAPHLNRALRIYSALERRRLETLAFRHVGDSISLATLLLDEAGVIGNLNEAARQLLVRNPHVAIKQDRLSFSQSSQQKRFDEKFNTLLEGKAKHDYDALVVSSQGGKALSILMRRIPRSGPDRRLRNAAVVIYLKESPQAGAALNDDIVATLFGLRPAEAKVASLLADGLNFQQIAQAMEVTEETVRTYSKRVFAKTGTSRQAELVKLVLTSLANLGS